MEWSNIYYSDWKNSAQIVKDKLIKLSNENIEHRKEREIYLKSYHRILSIVCLLL